MAVVRIDKSSFYFNGSVVAVAAQPITLADSVTAATGDGHYTISVKDTGVVWVTKGKTPARSTTMQHICGAIVLNDGANVFLSDMRNRGVLTESVNRTINALVAPDGSFLNDTAVTPNVLTPATLIATNANHIKDPNFDYADYGSTLTSPDALTLVQSLAATPWGFYAGGTPGPALSDGFTATPGNLVVVVVVGDVASPIPVAFPASGWNIAGISIGDQLPVVLWKPWAASDDLSVIDHFSSDCWASFKVFEFSNYDQLTPVIAAAPTPLVTGGPSGPMTVTSPTVYPAIGSLGFQASCANWFGDDPGSDVPAETAHTSGFTQTDSELLAETLIERSHRAYFDAKDVPVTSGEAGSGIAGTETIGANSLTGSLTGTCLSTIIFFVQPYTGQVLTPGSTIGRVDPYWTLDAGYGSAWYQKADGANYIKVDAACSGSEVKILTAAPLAVTPGVVYNFSADFDCTNASIGILPMYQPFCAIYDSTLSTKLQFLTFPPGSKGTVNADWLCPQGVTEIYFEMSTGACTLSGTLTMSKPMLTAGPGYQGWPQLGPAAVTKPRGVILKMSSADFTPVTTGLDIGGLAFVPYDPNDHEAAMSFNVIDIIARLETPASSGTTSIKVQRSTGTGAFSNVGYINTTTVDIAATLYEPTVRPAVIANPLVSSGDKLAPEMTAKGVGIIGLTLYVVLLEIL